MESKHLLDWLRDAHAMEKQAEKMLGAQASRLESYPELQQRIKQHLEETKGQLDKLEHCIGLLDAHASALKDLGAELTAFGQAMGGMMAGDEVIKGSVACYTFENFEIANYKVIIRAADLAGEAEISQICHEILQEELAMAHWLDKHIGETTQAFLERDQADHLRSKT
ncbi:ferritin-like domain-containing protein [Vreelandella malpeensis]|uniref:Ferritin-like domain-containing protein n=1 Tax=Vreelandella malpeensis TaxID=1172368 RepID=A0ABS8DPC5_9GAMM|nr:ferritin-like domain-containing protein [Halomonas malpeensis]MCB8888147.1 ferritin-like domain-containing protein [Halomonas malpeensis]